MSKVNIYNNLWYRNNASELFLRILGKLAKTWRTELIRCRCDALFMAMANNYVELWAITRTMLVSNIS